MGSDLTFESMQEENEEGKLFTRVLHSKSAVAGGKPLTVFQQLRYSSGTLKTRVLLSNKRGAGFDLLKRIFHLLDYFGVLAFPGSSSPNLLKPGVSVPTKSPGWYNTKIFSLSLAP